MNNVNKLFKLTDLIIGVVHYSKQILEGVQQSTLLTLQLLKNQYLPQDMEGFVQACLTNENLAQFMQESDLLDEDKHLNDPFKVLILKSILELPVEQDIIYFFFENNPINDKYFPEEVLQKLGENYEAFVAGEEQVHGDYKIHRMHNVYERFYLACIDTARDWSMFSKKEVEGVVKRELSYKIFTSADSFMSSIHNYTMYTNTKISQFSSGKSESELIVVPILGCTKLRVGSKEVYLQAIPHVYKGTGAPDGVNGYMKMQYRSSEEKDAEISNLQMRFQLPEQLIEQRLCSFAPDTVSEPAETSVPKINYTIELYHDQALVIDIGAVLDSTNKYDFAIPNVDATQWGVSN